MIYPLDPNETQRYSAELTRAMRDLLSAVCAPLFKVILREWQGEKLIRALGHQYPNEQDAPDVVRQWMDAYAHRVDIASAVPVEEGMRLRQRMILDMAYRQILGQALQSPSMVRFMAEIRNRRFLPFDLTQDQDDPRPYVLFCHLVRADEVAIDANTGGKIDRGELTPADIIKLAEGVRRFTKSWGENATPLALRLQSNAA